MKTTINFPENIVINRVHSSKVAMLVTLIVISIMMIFTTVVAEFSDSSIIPSITTVASIVGIISSAIIAMSLSRKVYATTESPLECVTLEFAESKCDEVLKAAADNRWSLIPSITKNSSGVAMKMEVVYSKDLTFAAYQLFSYVPHTYEACTQIFYIAKEDVARINFANLRN